MSLVLYCLSSLNHVALGFLSTQNIKKKGKNEHLIFSFTRRDENAGASETQFDQEGFFLLNNCVRDGDLEGRGHSCLLTPARRLVRYTICPIDRYRYVVSL